MIEGMVSENLRTSTLRTDHRVTMTHIDEDLLVDILMQMKGSNHGGKGHFLTPGSGQGHVAVLGALQLDGKQGREILDSDIVVNLTGVEAQFLITLPHPFLDLGMILLRLIVSMYKNVLPPV